MAPKTTEADLLDVVRKLRDTIYTFIDVNLLSQKLRDLNDLSIDERINTLIELLQRDQQYIIEFEKFIREHPLYKQIELKYKV
jgi:hypothetical protein